MGSFAVLSAEGRILGFYETRERALRGARNQHTRLGGNVQVVWCKDGVPKLWLAFVSDDGVSLTASWV